MKKNWKKLLAASLACTAFLGFGASQTTYAAYMLNPEVKDATPALKEASQIGVLKNENPQMANEENKDAIVVMSFGTTFKESRQKTIEATVAAIQQAHPDTKVVTAFTSHIIIDRIQDETARKFAIRAKELIDETNQQCSVLRTRFADLGYERVRDLYATARERVSAVAEIIKHVIDGDDDFRKPDSGNPQRNGSTTEQGRGRSE